MVKVRRPNVRGQRETNQERHLRRYSDPVERALINARNKAAKYKDRYGVSQEFADFVKKDGCAVCGTKSVKLCLDHCHKTGKIRGCLCNDCNVSLGRLGDDYERILRLAEYLRKNTELP